MKISPEQIHFVFDKFDITKDKIQVVEIPYPRQ